jgi:phytoene dehydrogenase-like protein
VVGKTLQKFKGPISVAAGAIATVYGGPVGGMAASQLTGPLIDSLAETGGDPTEFVKGIKKASGGDPKVDEALALAQRAASHATAAYHLTDTADRAVAGDRDAARKVAEIDSLAGSGDLAATQAMQIIVQALAAKFGGASANTVSGGFAGVAGPSSRSNRSRGRLRELRREAQDAAREAIAQFGGSGGVVGFVRYDDGGTSICEPLAARVTELGGRIRLGSRVERIAREADEWRVMWEGVEGEESVCATDVILATDPHNAKKKSSAFACPALPPCSRAGIFFHWSTRRRR